MFAINKFKNNQINAEFYRYINKTFKQNKENFNFLSQISLVPIFFLRLNVLINLTTFV